MLLARRRVERLAADAGSPTRRRSTTRRSPAAIEALATEEHGVSDARARRDRRARRAAGRAQAPLQGRPEPLPSLSPAFRSGNPPIRGMPSAGAPRSYPTGWAQLSDGRRVRRTCRMRFALHLPGCSVTAPKDEPYRSFPSGDRVRDPELPALQAQLTVFAREVGALCTRPSGRGADELELALRRAPGDYLATMTSFAQVVEAKDRTTAGHLDRTQRLGLQLAEAVDPGWRRSPRRATGSSSTTSARSASPSRSCASPAPLDREEWLVMREHPTIGATHRGADPLPRGRRRRSCGPTTSGGTARATRSVCGTSRSRSRPACSRSPTRSTR